MHTKLTSWILGVTLALVGAAHEQDARAAEGSYLPKGTTKGRLMAKQRKLQRQSNKAYNEGNPETVRPAVGRGVAASIRYLLKANLKTEKRMAPVLIGAARATNQIDQKYAAQVAYAWTPALMKAAGLSRDVASARRVVDHVVEKASVGDASQLVSRVLGKEALGRRISARQIVQRWADANGGMEKIKSDGWLGAVLTFVEERAQGPQLEGADARAFAVVVGMPHNTWKAKQIDRAHEAKSAGQKGATKRIDMTKNTSYGSFGLLAERTFAKAKREAIKRGLRRDAAEREAYAVAVVELFKDIQAISGARDLFDKGEQLKQLSVIGAGL